VFGSIREEETVLLRTMLVPYILFRFTLASTLESTCATPALLFRAVSLFAFSSGVKSLLILTRQRSEHLLRTSPQPIPAAIKLIPVVACAVATVHMVFCLWLHQPIFAFDGFALLCDAIPLAATISAGLSTLPSSTFLDFACDKIKLAVYLVYCAHVWYMKGASLSLLDVLMGFSVRAVWSKLKHDVSMYHNERRIEKGIETVFSDVPLSEIGEEEECAICRDVLRQSVHAVKRMPCGHVFHTLCIRHWISRNATCPMCRAPLVLKKSFSDPSSLAHLHHPHHHHHSSTHSAMGMTMGAIHLNPRTHQREPSFGLSPTNSADHVPTSPLSAGESPRAATRDTTSSTVRPLRRVSSIDVDQVNEIFPQLSRTVILRDLERTGNVQATIERLLS
jgi:autocrine motility factor receptor